MFPSHRESTFSLPMTKVMHIQAEEASQQFLPYFDKVEESYLNYLATYATQYYLKLLNYPVRESRAYPSDYVNQALSHGTTLQLPGYGVIACISVALGETTLDIPLFIQDIPIAYVAVEFDDALNHGSILGFLPQTDQATVSIDALQSLSELPGFLAQFNTLGSTITQLNRWWQRSFDQGWALISELTSTETPNLDPAWGRRSSQTSDTSNILPANQDQSEDGVMCQKTLQLGVNIVFLALTIEQLSTSSGPRINILIRLNPQLGQAYLPPHIQLTAADEADNIFVTLSSREYSPSLELRFQAEPGDYFSLKVACEGIALKEGFVV